MKNIFFLFTLLSFFFYTHNSIAQKQNKIIEYNEVKDLIEITYYYDNGSIQQIGSFNTNGLPHGKWIAFNIEGEKLCIGNYLNGLKQGKWHFLLTNKIRTVDYINSKIISVENTYSNDIAGLD